MVHDGGGTASACDGFRFLYGDRFFPDLDNDVALNCLVRVRAPDDIHSLARLNTRFNDLVKSGYLCELRKQILGTYDHHCLYFFYDHSSRHFDLELNRFVNVDTSFCEEFDPVTKISLRLPTIPSSDLNFTCSEIVVGNELLVFGCGESNTSLHWKYNFVHQNWVQCKDSVLDDRWFHSPPASCSYGSTAIIAGGVDKVCNTSSSAELYDSSTGKWESLPNMHTKRMLCSGFFMDRKFYVIGGLSDTCNKHHLTCGEELDLKTRKWRKIEGMYKNMKNFYGDYSPFVAVVDNQLYGVQLGTSTVAKYNKDVNVWIVWGRLPVHAVKNCWHLRSLRSWRDKLVVIEVGQRDGFPSILVSACCPNSGGTNHSALDWRVIGTWYREENCLDPR